MRIGVISDTHVPQSARELPEALLHHFKGVDLILHAGDIAHPSVLEALGEIAATVAVWGNMDPIPLRKRLEERRVLELEGFRVGLAHGDGGPYRLAERILRGMKAEKLDVLVFGHTHAPEARTACGVHVFNPGTPTDKLFSPFNSMGILELSSAGPKWQLIRL